MRKMLGDQEVVGEIREKPELFKCADGVLRNFPSFVNKCYLCKKPSRPYGFVRPGSAAIGLRAHLRRQHRVYGGKIEGWDD